MRHLLAALVLVTLLSLPVFAGDVNMPPEPPPQSLAQQVVVAVVLLVLSK